ncbi:MAG: glycosyltransferase family 4 protein [Acidobacteriaceae bacterium]|nr:glycosyltransferase family 4 protein [Acidobacteriaceae bacterium]
MLRFVFLCSNPGWGGSEELWAEAAALLVEGGHSVSIFKHDVDPKHPRICRLLAQGCHIYDLWHFFLPGRVRLPKTLYRVTGVLTRGARQTAALRAIGPILRVLLTNLNPDLVVISQGANFDGVILGDLCRIVGCPYVIISHRATDYYWPSDKSRVVMRSAFQAALRCYFVSQHNLRLTEFQMGETLVNAEVVRNPFLVSGSPLPWPDTQDHSIKLACVARLDAGEKGQDILLQVLARPHWRTRNLSVSFFGSGPNSEALRGLAEHLALKNVDFPGFTSDVDSIWKRHHALVLASRTEGLPLSLIEAMMCDRFGIVTNEGGTAEVVEDSRTGFVADSAKVDEFDKAMERAWAMRDEWKSIGQAAGIAVRTMVPLDPAACFTAKLLGVVDSLGASLPRRELQTGSIDLSDPSSLLQPGIATKLRN